MYHDHWYTVYPAPTTVTVTAPEGVIAGSSVTLTCAVELSPAVDVPVTVNTEWTGPGVIFMPANPVPAVMVNLTTYTSTVEVGVARNGSYTCNATTTFGGTSSGSTDITVGIILCYSFPVSPQYRYSFYHYSSPPSSHYPEGNCHSYLHYSDLGAARGS